MTPAALTRWCGALVLPAAVASVLLVAAPAAGASRYDPRLRFRTITTTHFVIYYHQGEEALAARLCKIVEPIHDKLTTRMKTAPRGRTHVILVDQADTANGWATPYPYNTIELTAAAPTAGDIIGNFDDWLALVFTHEYTHVLHLDRSEGWAGVGRHILGRSPLVLPNLYLPLWQTEGIATFQESAVTGRGRIPSGDFRAIVDEAARAGRPEPLDRVNGGLIDWPAGSAHYAYGAYFHQYLAERFGEDKLADLGEATARRFPYTGSKAFEYVFGESLGTLWKDFEAARTEAVALADPRVERAGRRLTHRGFLVRGPRFLPPAAGEPQAVLFTLSDQHDFPALYSIEVDGGRTRRLATRVGGDRVAVGRDALYFDQLEVVRNVRVEGDLYRLDRRSGDVRRVTHGLRVSDPDLSPDGRTIACVLNEPGRRALALIDLNAPDTPAILASEPETQYAAPRWSPDGRKLAVERLALSHPSQIVLVDVATRNMSRLPGWADSRNASPVWMPDGRTLLFASARGGAPFQIVAVNTDDLARSARQVTLTRAGATFPDVSSDGRTLVYVGYTNEGYDLFTMPLDPSTWPSLDPPPTFAPPRDTVTRGTGTVAPASRPYRPFATLVPRAWLPVLGGDEFQTRVGAQTDGVDALGRHAYYAAAAWWVAGERRPVLQAAGRPNWSAGYVYDRWRPTLFATASETDTLYPLARESAGRTTELLERNVAGGVIVPFVRMRHAHSVLGSVNYERDTATSGTRTRTFERSAFRLGWAFANAKEYGYSISSEEGLVVALTSEHVRRALGADGDADAATIDGRAFVRAGPRHAVVALRAAGGAASGDATVRRVFDLGGSDPRAALFDFGRDALSLLRGFDEGTFTGRRLVNANVEYRVPLWRIERGRGTWPIFVRTLHAALFADAGDAWDRRFNWRDLKTSYGGELAIDLVAGYFAPLTMAGGAAQGRAGAGGATQARYYVRIGRAF